MVIEQFTVSNSFYQVDMIYRCEKAFGQMNFMVSNIFNQNSDIGTVMRYFKFLKNVMKCDFFYCTSEADK